MSWGGEHMDGTGLFGCPKILFIPNCMEPAYMDGNVANEVFDRMISG